jgi:hypothetical protein
MPKMPNMKTDPTAVELDPTKKSWLDYHQVTVFIIIFLGFAAVAAGYYYTQILGLEPIYDPVVHTQTSNDILVKRYSYGGLCTTGSICSSTLAITRGGAVDVNGEYKVNFSNPDTQLMVKAVEEADYKTLASKAFTGTCPIAYDGQEVEYTFYTSHGSQVLDNCKVQIDNSSNLFRTLQKLLTKYVSS